MPDPEDMMYDAMMDAEYEHWYDQIIEDFKEDNLATFYAQNPNILLKSFQALEEAKIIKNLSPSGAYLLTFITIETLIKNSLIQAIVYGITHNENIANLISKNFLQLHTADKYVSMAFNLIKESIGLDFSTTKARTGLLIQNEIKKVAKKRNRIIHSAESCTLAEVEDALDIVEDLLENIIDPTLSKMNYQLISNKICQKAIPATIISHST